MSIRRYFFGFLLILIITTNCGVFEPDKSPGSLQIVLVKQEETGLEKSDETLGSVLCTVKKGTETKFDGSLTKQGSSFHGEVADLEPGSDYSVLLYGKNSGGEIIARGYQSGINVNAGKATTVQVSWNAFKPTLSAPVNGSTTSNNKPAFSWSSLSNAAAYELMVDNNSSFASPEIDQNNLTTAGYSSASSMADGTYYWKVRGRDSLGNWGGWSEVWSFALNSTTSNLIAYYPFNGNASDMSGNNYNGTIKNGTFVDDRFGNSQSAISVNGDGHINLGDVFNDITLPFSISVWINCKGVSIKELFFGTDVPLDQLTQWGGFAFNLNRMDGDGSTVFENYKLNVEYTNGLGRKTRQSNIDCPINQWVHLVGIIRNLSEMDLYINGQEAGGKYSGGAVSYEHNNCTAVIGPWFHGVIDNLRIYNKILSSAEIDQLYSEK